MRSSRSFGLQTETLKSLGTFNEIFLLQSSRFGEALRIVQDRLNSKNFYAFNPGFDCCE